ncbi:MAG TPA: hypothetical protein VIW29_09385 [Polyangiaceae bacterium]
MSRGCSAALCSSALALAVAAPLAAQAQSTDAAQTELLSVSSNEADTVWLPAGEGPYRTPAATAGLRFFAPAVRPGARPTPAVAGREYPRLGLLATAPGHLDLELGRGIVSIDAVEARLLDDRGQSIEPARSHAAFSRTLPSELGALPGPDRDAFELLLVAPAGAQLDRLELLSRSGSGVPLDVLPRLLALPAACPSGVAPELVCRRTPPLRSVADALDRNHPAAQGRSIRAELGGSLQVSVAGRKLLELPVGGPRQTRVGPIERLRARLRVFVMRSALAADDAGSKAAMQLELATAAALWGQCGIDFEAEVKMVDPPPTRLVTVGCGFGQPASGGALELRSGQSRVRLETRAGELPISVALRLAAELKRLGRQAQVFENQRTNDESAATADLLLSGRPFDTALAPLSSDPTLPLCLGQVELSDGLTHFRDGDAFAGTVEERALLRAFDDADPRSIEVLVVPSFARSERIGESFIASPGSSLSNAVIIDRWAIRAGARSFAFAHELGHVLLAMPGHPDDYGVDQSWSLMDADVADPTIFGPRRLSVADCERAVTQSGPSSPIPLLRPIPLR